MQFDEAIVNNLDLNFKVVFSGSEAASIQAFEKAEKNKEWLIGYFYEPQWLFADGRDMNLPRRGLHVHGMAECTHVFEKRQRVREKAASLLGENGRPPRTTALAIELDAQLRFERQQPVADALFGDPENAGGAPNLAVPRQLDERGDLVGAEVRQRRHAARTIQALR